MIFWRKWRNESHGSEMGPAYNGRKFNFNSCGFEKLLIEIRIITLWVNVVHLLYFFKFLLRDKLLSAPGVLAAPIMSHFLLTLGGTARSLELRWTNKIYFRVRMFGQLQTQQFWSIGFTTISSESMLQINDCSRKKMQLKITAISLSW